MGFLRVDNKIENRILFKVLFLRSLSFRLQISELNQKKNKDIIEMYSNIIVKEVESKERQEEP